MIKLIKWLFIKDSVWNHWQWYKGFFNITVLRYLVTWFAIVPVIGVLILNIPEQIAITIGDGTEYTVKIGFSLPFNWKLLWGSSLSFVIAYILYLIFCPRFIKTYSNYGNYKSFVHSPRWLAWVAKDIVTNKKEIHKFFERLSVKNYLKRTEYPVKNGHQISLPETLVHEDYSTLYFEYKDNVYSLSMPSEIQRLNREEVERDLFWEIFGRFSSSKIVVRFFIKYLLLISGGLFAFVLYQNIVSGVKLLF